MKVLLKDKNKIRDLEPIIIGRYKYTRTAPIMLDDYYGKVIDVKISKYPQYDFTFTAVNRFGEEGKVEWNLCKEWVDDIKSELILIKDV